MVNTLLDGPAELALSTDHVPFRNTPTLSTPSPFQSPTTGRLVASP